MNSFEVIELARKHVNNDSATQSSATQSSALSCLREAEALQAQGKCVHARNRAVKSLQYSVGILHPDYKAACITISSNIDYT